MKKIMLFVIMLSMLIFAQNVSAANAAARENEDGYSSLLAEYNKGIQTINVSGHQIITLYGYSECSSSGCDYTYSKTSSDFKEVLKKAIKCTNGEKYIIPQYMDNTEMYYKSGIDSSEQRITGRVAWSEDFDIACTNTPTSGALQVNNPNNQQTTQPSNIDGITSAGTTTNEDQGVETYYIILGIVGIITYFLTILVKKQNLFKKV